MLSLADSADNPLQTPLSHLEVRTILTKADAVEGLGKDSCKKNFLIFLIFFFGNSWQKVLETMVEQADTG